MNPILPGSTLGILGSGQLGRMLALEARRLGYRIHVLSTDSDSPTGVIADKEAICAYEDTDAVENFAREVDVVTLEFENIPVVTLEAALKHAPVRPGAQALHVAQHRLREKTFLKEKGFPVAPFWRIGSVEDVAAAFAEVGSPAILKTAGFGYDGKGQARVSTLEQTTTAFTALGGQEAVLEGFIPFDSELSVVAVRGLDGSFVHYGAIENRHQNGILDLSVAPPDLPESVVQEAVEIARGVLEALEVIGVMCVEFFLRGDSLIINEIAPRPHNSGHMTIDGCVTNQFEQQLRAVCGLPLGSTEFLRPAAMVNLLGDVWAAGEPDWAQALTLPGVKLHLYGKREARGGRKMGHLTALAETAKEAAATAQAARVALTRASG